MNKIFFIVGASGSGKSTIETGFLNQYYKEGLNEEYGDFTHIVSYATRNIRPGEIDGQDYYFISDEEFNQMDRSNEFIQKIEHAGSKKGTTIGEWKSKLKQGHVMLPILLDSVIQLQEELPKYIPGIETNMTLIFIDISAEEVYNRLITRYADEKGISFNELSEMYHDYNEGNYNSGDSELVNMFDEINERLKDIELLSRTKEYANYILPVDGKTPEQTIQEFGEIVLTVLNKS